jgi:RNA-binding protein
MPSLTPAERRALRARAHDLRPVVAVGRQGLTEAVLHEIDVALRAHELIKVRAAEDDRDEREALALRICAALGCAPVQHLGKLLILWRPRPAEPAPTTPRRRPATAAAPPPQRRTRRRAAAAEEMTSSRDHTRAAEDQSRRRAGATAPPTAPSAVPRAPATRRRRGR